MEVFAELKLFVSGNNKDKKGYDEMLDMVIKKHVHDFL